jgi:hypothetical protein
MPDFVTQAMPNETGQDVLRIRLPGELLREFKTRALARDDALGEYADKIFHYLWTENLAVTLTYPTMDESEEVYFGVVIPQSTKRRLTGISQGKNVNLASLSGRMVSTFLGEYDRDPRDLSVIHHVSSVLDEKGLISEAELKTALSRCLQNRSLKLPAGYLAKWLTGRVGKLITGFDRAGERVPLNVRIVEELLGEEQTP